MTIHNRANLIYDKSVLKSMGYADGVPKFFVKKQKKQRLTSLHKNA